jgi:NAD-dependent deacetylase
MEKFTPPWAEAQELLASAGRVTVLTGAGISTDSGIPDFRGPNGVWTKNPAAERTSRLADYLSDPGVRRQAWRNRLEHPSWGAVPNPGHRALVDLEAQGRLVALHTQNIDELHQRAGNNPDRVIELHGTMHHAVCWSCGDRQPMSAVLDRVRAGEPDPHCRRCGGIVKSATISFGQALDPQVLRRAEVAARSCDILLAVGSTLSVHPAAGYAPLAKRYGASLIIVNAEATAYDSIADSVVRGSISEVLPQLVRPMSAGPGVEEGARTNIEH